MMITLHDDAGRRMFSFNPPTDPYAVLHALAWAWPEGLPICGTRAWPCPLIDETGRHRRSYCLDCHCMGSWALEEARRRPEAQA